MQYVLLAPLMPSSRIQAPVYRFLALFVNQPAVSSIQIENNSFLVEVGLDTDFISFVQ